MAKSSVYLETTIIGHLVGRIHPDPVIAGRQKVTREWWDDEKEGYRLIISQVVVDECGAGDASAARERLEILQGLEFVPNSNDAQTLAATLVDRCAVPASEPRDAFHIAIAAANGVEYLLTWNFKHIANATTRELIEQTCRDAGCQPPIICTPEELRGA